MGCAQRAVQATSDDATRPGERLRGAQVSRSVALLRLTCAPRDGLDESEALWRGAGEWPRGQSEPSKQSPSRLESDR